MSAGGNDLIDAIQVMPNYGKNHPQEGQPIPKSLRILLRSDEWTPTAGPARYLSDLGWAAFSNYIKALVDELQQLRDSSHSLSKEVPLFLHCYDYLLPRNAPASLNVGPWLYPALDAYGVPPEDWKAVGVEVIIRFQSLLKSIKVPNLHIENTPGTFTAALPGSKGESNDWVNQIHPTRGGYQRLSAVYGAAVDALFP